MRMQVTVKYRKIKGKVEHAVKERTGKSQTLSGGFVGSHPVSL